MDPIVDVGDLQVEDLRVELHLEQAAAERRRWRAFERCGNPFGGRRYGERARFRRGGSIDRLLDARIRRRRRRPIGRRRLADERAERRLGERRRIVVREEAVRLGLADLRERAVDLSAHLVLLRESGRLAAERLRDVERALERRERVLLRALEPGDVLEHIRLREHLQRAAQSQRIRKLRRLLDVDDRLR